MKKIILALLIIMFSVSISFAETVATFSFNPPVGNCRSDEVWRCVQGPCFTTLLYCPPVFEDGKAIINESCNKTTCNWNCECVKKKKTIIPDINDADMFQIDTAIIYLK